MEVVSEMYYSFSRWGYFMVPYNKLPVYINREILHTVLLQAEQTCAHCGDGARHTVINWYAFKMIL